MTQPAVDTAQQPVQAKRRGRPTGSESAKKRQTVANLVRSTPGISLREIEAQTGISKTTAQAYLSKWGIDKGELDVFVENRNSIVKSKQEEILRALTPDKLQKATAKDLTVAYGIMLDKDRLESGESTGSINNWIVMVQAANNSPNSNAPVDITPKSD